jgi:hypothetical protein
MKHNCKTYSKTPTLGKEKYKGQRRLVADAIRDAKERRLTACEITVLTNLEGAYFRTLEGGREGYVMTEFRGGGAAGIIGSVQYHLRGLVKAGELVEHE